MVPWTYPFKTHPGATGDGTGGCEEGTDGRSTAKGDLLPLQQMEQGGRIVGRMIGKPVQE